MNDGAARDVRMIADSMLGRLAKWLRMLGFDVAYDRFIADDELIRRAREEGRVMLTRDTGVVRRRGLPRTVFVTSDHVGEQVAQVARELGLTFDMRAALTRCTVCNGLIERVPKEAIKDEVPPYVFRTQQTFAKCSGCGRIYWRGTHVERMELKLARMMGTNCVGFPMSDGE
jgi:uncharacterized protein with PIN domain